MYLCPKHWTLKNFATECQPTSQVLSTVDRRPSPDYHTQHPATRPRTHGVKRVSWPRPLLVLRINRRCVHFILRSSLLSVNVTISACKIVKITRRLTRRCFVESKYLRPLLNHATFRVSVFTVFSWTEIHWLLVLGLQRVRMSRNHVFHGGLKYTVLSLSGRGMSLV